MTAESVCISVIGDPVVIGCKLAADFNKITDLHRENQTLAKIASDAVKLITGVGSDHRR